MTHTNPNARNLGITAIKTEIQRRNPVDAKAAEDAVASRLRIDELGQPYVVDKSGVRDDYKCLEQFLDEVVRDRPDLWQGRPSSTTGGSTSKTTDNPFMKGPSFNVTKQMALLKTNPTEARKLAWDAGLAL